eukprot:IDg10822t1
MLGIQRVSSRHVHELLELAVEPIDKDSNQRLIVVPLPVRFMMLVNRSEYSCTDSFGLSRIDMRSRIGLSRSAGDSKCERGKQRREPARLRNIVGLEESLDLAQELTLKRLGGVETQDRIVHLVHQLIASLLQVIELPGVGTLVRCVQRVIVRTFGISKHDHHGLQGVVALDVRHYSAQMRRRGGKAPAAVGSACADLKNAVPGVVAVEP